MKAVLMTAPAVDGSTTSVAEIDEPRPGPGQVANRSNRWPRSTTCSPRAAAAASTSPKCAADASRLLRPRRWPA